MTDIVLIGFQFAVLMFSIIIHEISHGAVAFYLGDRTAARAGRLTMNPLKHLDPFGSVILPIMLAFVHAPIMGWAKPVPYNPFALFKDYKYGPLKVALAGPLSNFALAFIFGIISRIASGVGNEMLTTLFYVATLLNCYLAVFNLVPVPPLDGSEILSTLFPKACGWMRYSGVKSFIFVYIIAYFCSAPIQWLAIAIAGLLTGI